MTEPTYVICQVDEAGKPVPAIGACLTIMRYVDAEAAVRAADIYSKPEAPGAPARRYSTFKLEPLA